MRVIINKKEKGVSIYLALIILVILLVTIFGLIDILLRQRRITKEIEFSSIVLGAANAGIEHILYLDKLCTAPGCYVNCYPPTIPSNCCKDDCTGLKDGILIQGTTTAPNGEIIFYNANISRNCGINTVTCTASYKGVSKTISTSVGASLIGLYLNSATPTCPCDDDCYYSCEELCERLDCACYSVGTNTSTIPDNREVVFFTTTTQCTRETIPPDWDACEVSKMIRNPACGEGWQEVCPSSEGESHPTAWTYCYCTGTSP